MGDAHLRILVAADLEELRRCVENAVGVGHLLGADQPFAGKVCRRSDVFVNHRVGTPGTILFVAHLFTDAVLEPVGRPRLSFGNVVVHAALQWEESTAISLCTRFHAQLAAPVGVRNRKSIAEHLGLGQLNVVPHAVDHLFEFGSHLDPVVIIENVTHSSGLEHRILEVGHDVISTAFLELSSKITAPVGTLKLHRVGEQGTNVLCQRAELSLDGIGHVVQVFFDSRTVQMVQRRALCTGSTANYRPERIDAYQCVECIFALRNLDCKSTFFIDFVAEVDHLIQAAQRFGNQLQREQVRNPS